MSKTLKIVGIGPGSYDMMTMQAARVLEESTCIVGYHVYVDLVKDRYPDKKFLTTPMKKEEERCRMAFEEAESGEDVAFVCSGDAGVYGMAGLIYSMSEDHPGVEVEVIPGITAALSGAAVLGAPLIHDFCLISLSDLLTPWEKIEKRLKCAGEGDFCIVIYNPSSHKRADYLKKACEILLQSRDASQVCGLAANIGREGEQYEICTLGELKEKQVDMFTTVFIGNSSTTVVNGRMVTPRGYTSEKEKLS